MMTEANTDIILWGVFALVLLGLGSVAIVASILSSPNRHMAQRVARLKERYTAANPSMAAARRLLSNASLGNWEEFLKRVLPRPDELRTRLNRTGRKISLAHYALITVFVWIALTVVLMTFVGLPWAASLLFGLFGGAGLPHFVVNSMIRTRLEKFTKLFPEAIDLIVRGLKSGLPVTESIQAVGQEMADPIGVEFRRIADDVRLGKTLEDALWHASTKLDTPEFKFFVISLAVQKETGGNLAETLGNLSDILRNRQKMKLKIKAMSSEGKASAMIIGSLPFIMFGLISLVNYSYASVLFTDPRAQIASIGGLIWMGIGMFIISKMISFEI